MDGGKTATSLVKETPNPMEHGTGMASSTSTHNNTPAKAGANPVAPPAPGIAPASQPTSGTPGGVAPEG